MSTYSLSGTGVQALSANVTALRISITTLPAGLPSGRANPTNHFDIGLVRFSDGTAYWTPVPILGGPQWVGVPAGSTSIGYKLLNGAVVSVVEVIGGTSPFAFAPSTLAYASVLSAAMDYCAAHSGASPIDQLLNNGDWYAFVFFLTQTSAGFHAATNATLAVPAGRTLILVQAFFDPQINDTANRGAMFFDSTAGADIYTSRQNWAGSMLFRDAIANRFPQIPTGHTAVARVWDTDATSRGSGAIWLAKLA